MSATGRMLLALALALGLGALLMAGGAQAACNPLSLCSCTASTSGVSFGSYDPLATSPNDSTATITVTCTLLVSLAGSYTVGLSTGTSNSFTTRTLKSGGANLNYNLFTDTARTQIWGDGTGGTQTETGSFPALLLNVQNFTVYGRIPASQNVPGGAYADTVVVTVTY